MIKKILNFVTVALAFVTITSCASTAVEKSPATVTKHEDSMLWEINSTDKNGEPSKLYVLGTFHLADDRLFPIPEDIITAFDSADKYYGELSSDDFNNMAKIVMEEQMASMQREVARIESTGETFIDTFTKEQIAYAKELLGGEEMLAGFVAFEPWVLSTFLTTALPITMLGFGNGYDVELYARSAEQGKSIIGLDELQTQIELLKFGTREEQIESIKLMLDSLMAGEDPTEPILELYEAYLSADENRLAEVLEKQTSESTEANKESSEKFEQAIFAERNTEWAKIFAELLNEGGVTFVFAGAGHFVGEDSVFNYMVENGDLAY